MTYLTGQVLQSDFSDVGYGTQAVPLRALPLVDGLPVDGVPQLLSALKGLLLVYLQCVHRKGSLANKHILSKHVYLDFFSKFVYCKGS